MDHFRVGAPGVLGVPRPWFGPVSNRRVPGPRWAEGCQRHGHGPWCGPLVGVPDKNYPRAICRWSPKPFFSLPTPRRRCVRCGVRSLTEPTCRCPPFDSFGRRGTRAQHRSLRLIRSVGVGRDTIAKSLPEYVLGESCALTRQLYHRGWMVVIGWYTWHVEHAVRVGHI